MGVCVCVCVCACGGGGGCARETTLECTLGVEPTRRQCVHRSQQPANIETYGLTAGPSKDEAVCAMGHHLQPPRLSWLQTARVYRPPCATGRKALGSGVSHSDPMLTGEFLPAAILQQHREKLLDMDSDELLRFLSILPKTNIDMVSVPIPPPVCLCVLSHLQAAPHGSPMVGVAKNSQTDLFRTCAIASGAMGLFLSAQQNVEVHLMSYLTACV